ncbi:MAG: GGDEF domain-containing protein [Coriobacteriia bacterium]|nr:GGDEF domain-containing protein [Coriobacteriia bacterium]
MSSETLQQQNSRLWDLLTTGALLSKTMFVFLCVTGLLFFYSALLRRLRHRLEGTHFIVLCAAAVFWSVCSMFALFTPPSAEMLGTLSLVGIAPIPALLCLHIQQQVSHREQEIVPSLLLFFVPGFLMFKIINDLFFPTVLPILPPISETEWYMIAFNLYATVALVRSYLLCFNVFYQMPKRARRSTWYMLIGVTAIVVLLAFGELWKVQLSELIPTSEILDILLPLGAPVALLITLYVFYNALLVMPASEVIVTSREFVMGGLSTAVLILNQQQEILDWNRTDWEEGYPLPKPLFREPISVYRKRMVTQNNFRVSPHDDNIIITNQDDIERYFLFDTHIASNSKRTFGYVLEISEVSPMYTLLRYFEEIAHFDTLTGLHNRNGYFNYLSTIVAEENMPLLIFVGDVNYLKTVNDTYGHLVGDELLKTVAEVIKLAMPAGAFAARTGGDEFVVLIPGAGERIAERFKEDLISLCSRVSHKVFGAPSISWGYAIMQSTSQSYNDIYEQADSIMYEYKKTRLETRGSGLLPSRQAEPEPDSD